VAEEVHHRLRRHQYILLLIVDDFWNDYWELTARKQEKNEDVMNHLTN